MHQIMKICKEFAGALTLNDAPVSYIEHALIGYFQIGSGCHVKSHIR